MVKANELRAISIAELEAQHLELCREIFLLVNKGKLEKRVESPHLVRQKKKDRARVLTILREKQLLDLGSAQ